MTPEELTAALDRLNLTAYALAKQLQYGGKGGRIRMMMKGERPIPTLLAHVVNAMSQGYKP